MNEDTFFRNFVSVLYLSIIYRFREFLHIFWTRDFDLLSYSESLLEIFATGKWVE